MQIDFIYSVFSLQNVVLLTSLGMRSCTISGLVAEMLGLVFLTVAMSSVQDAIGGYWPSGLPFFDLQLQKTHAHYSFQLNLITVDINPFLVQTLDLLLVNLADGTDCYMSHFRYNY